MFEVSFMATDPVCKMNVVEVDAKYTSIHDGRKFFFCSAACKHQFDGNPQRYVK
jgi:Cu+-exporting ATPase